MNPIVPPTNTSDHRAQEDDHFSPAETLHVALVSSRQMDDSPERQLNIHMDPANLAGVYANFANITFSDYEFTLTFARIDHEVEEGDVPGVVVSRVNMSQQFMRELLAAMQDAYSKYTTVKGIHDLPETDDHS